MYDTTIDGWIDERPVYGLTGVIKCRTGIVWSYLYDDTHGVSLAGMGQMGGMIDDYFVLY